MQNNSRFLVFVPEHDRLFPKSIIAPSLLVERMDKHRPRLSAWIERDGGYLDFRRHWTNGRRTAYNTCLFIERFPSDLSRRWEINLTVDERERRAIRRILSELGQTVGGTTTVEHGCTSTLLSEDDLLFPNTRISAHRLANQLMTALGWLYRVQVIPAELGHPLPRLRILRRQYRNFAWEAEITLPTVEKPTRFITLTNVRSRRQAFFQHLTMIVSRLGDQRPPMGF